MLQPVKRKDGWYAEDDETGEVANKKPFPSKMATLKFISSMDTMKSAVPKSVPQMPAMGAPNMPMGGPPMGGSPPPQMPMVPGQAGPATASPMERLTMLLRQKGGNASGGKPNPLVRS